MDRFPIGRLADFVKKEIKLIPKGTNLLRLFKYYLGIIF